MTTHTGHTQAILASRVIGTPVYNLTGDKIGKIEDVVLDKLHNNIMFAAIGFGGFLGMGEKYHPIPWMSLDYDQDKDGYIVPFEKSQLEAGPAGSLSDLTRDDGHRYRDESYRYYRVDPYWT